MFVIGKDQLDAMQESLRHELHERIRRALHQHLPHQILLGDGDTAAVLRRIDSAHRAASSFGISTEHGITQFVTLSFVVGPDFHQQTAIHHFLTLPDATGDEKIALLSNLIVHRATTKE
jgi:hypothetical protein